VVFFRERRRRFRDIFAGTASPSAGAGASDALGFCCLADPFFCGDPAYGFRRI
jgi:hypothetical protein